MPAVQPISPEAYSEFVRAFDVFTSTRRFENEILTRINTQPKPVLLVEGISDSILINVAWKKLRPAEPIPFEVIACGIEPDPEARGGGAETLRRCLEFLAIASDRPILALFDNDRSGNEQFNGINMRAFDYNHTVQAKRHKAKNAHAILLPAPPGRELFVTPNSIMHRYLSIEHYFADELLAAHSVKGDNILNTAVFEIHGKHKVAFANKAALFPSEQFANFNGLLDRLSEFL